MKLVLRQGWNAGMADRSYHGLPRLSQDALLCTTVDISVVECQLFYSKELS